MAVAAAVGIAAGDWRCAGIFRQGLQLARNNISDVDEILHFELPGAGVPMFIIGLELNPPSFGNRVAFDFLALAPRYC